LADELIIQGLRVPRGNGSRPVVIDAIVETELGRAGEGQLTHEDICHEIERLCGNESSEALEAIATRVVDGLLKLYPRVQGFDVTVRMLQPTLSGFEVEAIGVRKTRRRPKPPQRLPRREIRPLPRP
jgi:dihydroneopterin aldolase